MRLLAWLLLLKPSNCTDSLKTVVNEVIIEIVNKYLKGMKLINESYQNSIIWATLGF